jgi:hypothetical protein
MIPNQKSFDDLLTWLSPNRNEAGQKYKEIYYKLVKFFEWNGCHTPEECADKTIDTIARKIEEGPLIRDSKGEVVTKKDSYVFGVAKRILWAYRRDQKEIEIVDLMDADIPVYNEDVSVRDCRTYCLGELDKYHPQEWKLLNHYYRGGKISKRRRLRIAKKLGMSLNALVIRVSRIKEELWPEYETCMKNCLRKWDLF